MSEKDTGKRVYEHLEEAMKFMGVDMSQIFGIVNVGSQNYGLDTQDSDVDTRVITIPSIEDIALNKKPISTTMKLENGEQITIVDYRLWMKQLCKQNINSLESLFAKVSIINGNYMDIWSKLEGLGERISHLNMGKTVLAACSLGLHKYNYIHRAYPSNEKLIAKFGYDPKSLATMFRVKDFVERYLAGETFEKCLIPIEKEHIKQIKLGKVYTAEEAKHVKEELRKEIDSIFSDILQNGVSMEEYNEKAKRLNNQDIEITKDSIDKTMEQMEECSIEIMKKAMRLAL